jgi:hypothetical protein
MFNRIPAVVVRPGEVDGGKNRILLPAASGLISSQSFAYSNPAELPLQRKKSCILAGIWLSFS